MRSIDARRFPGALAGWVRPHNLGISARSATVSAIVVLFALSLAGVGSDLILYRSLLAGVDDATAARVRAITHALQTHSPSELDGSLLATNQQVVAVQIVAPDKRVVVRSGLAPDTLLVPASEFDLDLRRGMSDDAVAGDDMRVSGQKVDNRLGQYTVIVGGGSEAVEATAGTVALLLAGAAPIIVAVAAAASYWLVRRSLQSVDDIRGRVAEITASDLSERVPVPGSHDAIAALATTMNEMLARVEAGHLAQQRFLSDASHELRSPLATIISGLEAAEAHPELLDTELAINTLLPEAHRMQTMIEDLLLLARADERSLILRRERVSLGDLTAAEAAHARRRSNCAIHTDLSPTHLICEPAAISRLIRNLVENAVRHATSRIDIEVTSQNGNAILAVSDDGPGIEPAERDRVFGRFVRLDFDRARHHGGAGLGLAIVADVVTAHGGSVRIDNAAGLSGARVTVELPQRPNG